MSKVADVPRSLGTADERSERRSLVHRSHVAPLTAFVDTLRRQVGTDDGIPYFDPLDGGVLAECLFLLEAPGPRAVESGFVSRNNPDETAKNFLLLNQEAGLQRQRTVIWNVVPWYVGSGTKIRPATSADITAGTPHLVQLLGLLPRVRGVVLLGVKAQRAHKIVDAVRPDCKTFCCQHPSPLALNGRPQRRSELLGCLKSVVAFLDRTHE